MKPDEGKNHDEKEKDKDFRIFVNTRAEKWDKKEISFREVVALA
jgi:hypothetical protein